MEVCLEKTKRVLRVLFSDAELAEKHFEGESFRHLYKCSGGMTFTFEKKASGLSLDISFGKSLNPRFHNPTSYFQSLEQLNMLWDIGHLPFARIHSSNIPLFLEGTAEIIDSVSFEVRKVGDGIMESKGTESEACRLKRQMRLKRLKDGNPEVYGKTAAEGEAAGQARSAEKRVIFVDDVIETEPDSLFGGMRATADGPNDPRTVAECDGCEELFFESELTEVRPGLWLCEICKTDNFAAGEHGLTLEELPSLGDRECVECGLFFGEEHMEEVEPGRWVCHDCQITPLGT
jgi:hypothetical protein